MVGIRLPSREGHKTFVEVLDTTKTEDNEAVIDALVTGWNASKAVRFPRSMLPKELMETVDIGTLLTAKVNIGAGKSTELYFGDFELAPEPDENDGFA